LNFILSFDDDLKSLPPLQEVSFDANLVESDGIVDLMTWRIYITKAAVFVVYLEAFWLTGFQLNFGGKLLAMDVETVSNYFFCIRPIEGVHILWILFC
jgi:hypothetical protein